VVTGSPVKLDGTGIPGGTLSFAVRDQWNAADVSVSYPDVQDPKPGSSHQRRTVIKREPVRCR